MSQAIIIGSGGIASAMATTLFQDGWSLFIASRNSETGAALATSCQAEFFQVDATAPESMKALLQQVKTWRGASDEKCAVVNTVGSILLKPAHLTSVDEWHHTLRQNLDSAFFSLQLAAQVKGCDSLLLFSSAAAQLGLANHEAIAAAKAGVEGLIRSAATTYAARGLRVNGMAMGLVDTPLAAPITSRPAGKQASEKMHPLGRIGSAQEIAATAVHLLQQSWVTGAIWNHDGGLSQCRTN